MVTFGPTMSAVSDDAGNVHVSANRCDTCMHWTAFKEPSASDEAERIKFGCVNSPKTANRLGLCEAVPMMNDLLRYDSESNEPLEPDETLAAVEDLSDNAFLRTNAGFGCVLWEAK